MKFEFPKPPRGSDDVNVGSWKGGGKLRKKNKVLKTSATIRRLEKIAVVG